MISMLPRKFQFHLVRLKESEEDYKQQIEAHVSIPFSTIKSILCHVLFYLCSEFQFHLVRLKAYDRRLVHIYIVVSIPFSTIKRKAEPIPISSPSCFNSI